MEEIVATFEAVDDWLRQAHTKYGMRGNQRLRALGDDRPLGTTSGGITRAAPPALPSTRLVVALPC
jgi:hypothetical protein